MRHCPLDIVVASGCVIVPGKKVGLGEESIYSIITMIYFLFVLKSYVFFFPPMYFFIFPCSYSHH